MSDLDPAADPAKPHNGLPVLLMTGPTSDTHVIAGVAYDLTPESVLVDPEHLDELHHRIEETLEGRVEAFTHDRVACGHCPDTSAEA